MLAPSKSRKGLHPALSLLLAAAPAAALVWYYDVYVHWQPAVFPLALIVLTIGIAALTLSVLLARDERKATALLWKTVVSAVAFTGVSLCGVSAIINNVIGKEGMARQAAAVAMPLAAAQILVLCVLSLLPAGKRVARKWIALTAAGCVVMLLVSVGCSLVMPWYYREVYRAPTPQLKEGSFEPMPALDKVDYTVPDDGTIEEVRDLIRQERADGADRHYTVLIGDGEYNIKQIAFDERDHDTTYRSRDGGVILNGGMRLEAKEFAPVSGEAAGRLTEEARANVVQIDLTALGLIADDWGKMYSFGSYTTAPKYDGGTGPLPCELFFNGKRCVTARYPNGGDWLRIGRIIDNGETSETYDNGGTQRRTDWGEVRGPRGGTFEMDKETAARAAGWASLDDVWMFGCFKHDWADMSTPVKAIDSVAGTVTAQYASMYGYETGKTYYFYNVLEELDEPGEWYLDRDKGVLYLWPPEGDFADARLDLSLSTQTLISGKNLKNISFIGLTLQGTRGSGMGLSGDGITVDHCVIRCVAGDALSLDGYRNTASNNEISRVGGRGISLDGGDAETLTPGGNKAVNNLIHDWAQVSMTYHAGVSFGGTGNLVAHNELYNSPHAAIIFGGNQNVIEYNLIHDVCLLTHDAGAVYAGRSFYDSQGTVVRYNAIYNLGGGLASNNSFRPCGIYLDDGLSGLAVLGNLLVNVPGNAIAISGRDLEVRGNITVNASVPLSYDERTRQGALATDPDFWFYAHTGQGGDMWKNLLASPWQTDIWKAAFPKLAALSKDFDDIEKPSFAANPAGSSVTGNVFVGANKPKYDKSVLQFSEIGPNGEYGIGQMKALFADAAKGDYSVPSDSKIYRDFPAWADGALPQAAYGRIPDATP